MGIIINQSAKNLILTYAGFGIGAINTLFLYTNFLEQEYYGLVSFLLSAANLIWPLMAFGVHNTLVKFYSSYTTKIERDRLLTLILFLPLLMSVVLGFIGYFSYGVILSYFTEENELVQPYVWLIFLIAAATAYFEVFFSWEKINYRSVFGNFMKEVFHRLSVSILLMAVYFKWISVEHFIYSLTIVFIFRAVVMMLYAFRLYFPKLDFQMPHNRTSVLKYSALILIAGSVAMVLLDLDKVMIGWYIPIENVAIYGIAVYIASVIAVPSRAMHQITYPLTATLLNNRDRKGLKELYEKSPINLLLISGFIFLLIITNVRQLYELIPDEYQISFSIVVLISCVKLYDNLLGNNNSILYNSDYYRLVLAIGVLLAIIAFLLNTVFIPSFGIFGAAMSTLISFAAYNTTKILIVGKKYRIYPFTTKTGYALLIILLFSLSFYFWDFTFHPVVNIILKSIIMGLIYLPLIFYLKLSKDINKLMLDLLKLKLK